MRRPATPAPAPVTETAKRLEAVKERMGFPSLRSFHAHLADGWSKDDGRVSYEAVRNYHFDREPPVAYLSRIADLFGVRLEWLVSGDGPMTEVEAQALAQMAGDAEPEDEWGVSTEELKAVFVQELPEIDRASRTCWGALSDLYVEYLLSDHSPLGTENIERLRQGPARVDVDVLRDAQLQAARRVATAVSASATALEVDLSALPLWHLNHFILAAGQAVSTLLYGVAAADRARHRREPMNEGR